MFSPDIKVLIVDDMRSMRIMMRQRLSELGFNHVTEAEDGNLAWAEVTRAMSKGEKFQLIISDWIMPNSKGIHLLNRVRANSEMKNTPFIMVTAENELDSVREALAAHVTAYIVKPFTPEAFKEKMEVAYQASLHTTPAKKSA